MAAFIRVDSLRILNSSLPGQDIALSGSELFLIRDILASVVIVPELSADKDLIDALTAQLLSKL